MSCGLGGLHGAMWSSARPMKLEETGKGAASLTQEEVAGMPYGRSDRTGMLYEFVCRGA